MTRTQGITLAAVAAIAAGYAAAWHYGAGFALNTTGSMQRGLYVSTPLKKTPQRGQVVSLCIPDAQSAAVYLEREYLPASTACPSGIAPVMKPVAAVPGDVVAISDAGTAVNGWLLPRSRVYGSDSAGRPIHHLPVGWSKTLQPGEFFVLANHAERSLDSRYYGTVHRQDMHLSVFPLLTY